MASRGSVLRYVAVGVGALMLTVAVGSPATADPRDFFSPDGLSVRGAATSQVGGDDYGLGVYARTAEAPEDARGQFRFGHNGPDEQRGIAGEVRCLARDAAGLIQVSGRIFASGGQDNVGQDFAATVDVDSEPQQFSDITVGEPGTIAPCGGGQPGFHPVTEGGYRASDG